MPNYFVLPKIHALEELLKQWIKSDKILRKENQRLTLKIKNLEKELERYNRGFSKR